MAASDPATDFFAAHTVPYLPTHFTEECPICLETFTTEAAVQIVGIQDCNHVFGANCLTSLLNSALGTEKKCPLCRTVWIPAEQPFQTLQTGARHMAGLMSMENRIVAVQQALERQRGLEGGLSAEARASHQERLLMNLTSSGDETAGNRPSSSLFQHNIFDVNLARGHGVSVRNSPPFASDDDDDNVIDFDAAPRTTPNHAVSPHPTPTIEGNDEGNDVAQVNYLKNLRRAQARNQRLSEMRLRLGREGEGDGEVTAANVAALQRDIDGIRARAGTWRNRNRHSNNSNRARDNSNQQQNQVDTNPPPARPQSLLKFSHLSPTTSFRAQSLDTREDMLVTRERLLQDRERALEERERAVTERERMLANYVQRLRRQRVEWDQMHRQHTDELNGLGIFGEFQGKCNSKPRDFEQTRTELEVAEMRLLWE